MVDPWGTVIAQCREGTSIALAAVDLNYLKNLRLEMPVASHRRHDIYQLPVQDSRCMDLPSDTESFPFGQVTIRGWGVFYRGRSSIAFVNRKCVVPGRKLLYSTQITFPPLMKWLTSVKNLIFFFRCSGDPNSTGAATDRFTPRRNIRLVSDSPESAAWNGTLPSDFFIDCNCPRWPRCWSIHQSTINPALLRLSNLQFSVRRL